MNLSPGDVAPDFTLPDQDRNDWTLSDHRGRPVVLYFYPKDGTPGCTNQACDVRDHWADFAGRNIAVAGISPDPVETHASFAAELSLPHTLLADPERKVIDAYGAWGERTLSGRRFMGVIRSSVVVDPEGRVRAVFETIQPNQQSEKALAALDT